MSFDEKIHEGKFIYFQGTKQYSEETFAIFREDKHLEVFRLLLMCMMIPAQMFAS